MVEERKRARNAGLCLLCHIITNISAKDYQWNLFALSKKKMMDHLETSKKFGTLVYKWHEE